MSDETYNDYDTTTLLLYVAVCFKCRQSPDDDGGEYQVTPEKAVQQALTYYGWKRDEDDHLICDEHGEEAA